MDKQWLRRRTIVDWGLQGSICLHVVMHGCLVLLTVCVGVFGPLLWRLAGESGGSVLADEAIVMLYMHDRFWLLAALCLLIIGLSSLRFSHRIAGPLVRYKRNLRLLAEGQLPSPLRTRRGDFLQDEVVCLNRAVAGVGARVDELRRSCAALWPEIDGLLAVAAGDPEQACRLLAARQAVEAALHAFRAVDTGDDRLPQLEQQGRPALAAVAEGS